MTRRDQREGQISSVFPMNIVGWARSFAPGTASLAAGALALLAVGLFGWRAGLGPRQILEFGGAVLVLGFAGAVLATLVGTRRHTTLQSNALSWIVVVFIAIVLTLLLLAAFTPLLPQGSIFLARTLGWAELLPVSDHLRPVANDVHLESLGDLVAPISNSKDAISRVKAFNDRGTLRIADGGRLIASNNDPRTIAVHTLELDNGEIVTNGASLTIEVVDLKSNGGRLVSFDPNNSASNGANALKVGKTTLIVHGSISGQLKVDLAGQGGSNGDNGQPGAAGADGGAGANASSGVGCERGAERGRDGQPGHPGAAGSPGGRGGDGGSLIVNARDPAAARSAIDFSAPGGLGGQGGNGGPGGPGGRGGSGGGPRGFCSGGAPNGVSGPQGPTGPNGANGQTGRDGNLVVEPIPTNF